jgi:signal transduction histidine kinase
VHRSLTFRITTLSIGWIAAALVVTGLLLTYFYQDHIEEHYDAHVFSHLKELVAASQIGPDGTFSLTSQPTDPRFHEPLSGWYWEIRQDGTTIARSGSLGELSLELRHVDVPDAQHVHVMTGPNKQKLRVQVLGFAVPGTREQMIYIASAPVIPIVSDVANYKGHVRMSLLALGLGLMVAVVLQIRLALRPLKAIGSAIIDVRSGRRKRLPRNFPTDVQPLVDELNRLLAHNTFLLKRARNQLGDLAHSVKNPLAVINNEAQNLPEEQRDLLLRQTGEISRNIDHYLSRARSYGQANMMGYHTAVKPVVEDLVFVLRRTYQDRDIEFIISGIEECWFSGEAQDLEEMLGNLLDNAAKWANQRVWLTGTVGDDQLILVIEDDGRGVDDEEIDRIVQRGYKVEENGRGHGLGLSIVQELVKLYGGTLQLNRSPRGGLRAELRFGAGW